MGVDIPQKFQGVRSPFMDIFAPRLVNWSIFVEMDADEDVVRVRVLGNVAMSRNSVCHTPGTTRPRHLSDSV